MPRGGRSALGRVNPGERLFFGPVWQRLKILQEQSHRLLMDAPPQVTDHTRMTQLRGAQQMKGDGGATVCDEAVFRPSGPDRLLSFSCEKRRIRATRSCPQRCFYTALLQLQFSQSLDIDALSIEAFKKSNTNTSDLGIHATGLQMQKADRACDVRSCARSDARLMTGRGWTRRYRSRP